MTNTNAFIVSKPIHAPLTRDPRPAQYALGFSELEWQGYEASCIRVQQVAALRQDAALSSTDAECSKKGPNAAALDP
jgi:hypothetical protein